MGKTVFREGYINKEAGTDTPPPIVVVSYGNLHLISVGDNELASTVCKHVTDDKNP
jgi:hypothetical protein